MHSPDIILSKLRWYEMGGRVSERQWLDILGVVKVQGDSLDRSYLITWSKVAGVSDLLERAFVPRDESLGYGLSPAGLGWCSDAEFPP